MGESPHGTGPVELGQRVVVPEHVTTKRLDDELVLLNYESESYFGLDEVGTRIFEVLSAAPTIETGIGELLEEFDVDADRLRADVQELVRTLVDGGLVELRSG